MKNVTDDRRQKVLDEIERLKESGLTLSQAIARVKIRKGTYYTWRARMKKKGKAKVETLVTYSAKRPVRRQAVAISPMNGNMLMVFGTPEQLVEFYKKIGEGK